MIPTEVIAGDARVVMLRPAARPPVAEVRARLLARRARVAACPSRPAGACGCTGGVVCAPGGLQAGRWVTEADCDDCLSADRGP